MRYPIMIYRWLLMALTVIILAGCTSVQGGPNRLYNPVDELSKARKLIDGNNIQTGLVARYYDPSIGDKKFYRNEIVTRRMYIIDVEYTEYEKSLTSERQKLGFVAGTTSQGLSTAGALVSPASTTRLLSGLAGAVSATKGIYDSEVIIAKTIQIAEAQMRAQRDKVATRIYLRLQQPVSDYPLSAALSDLEDYYRAGTLNSGLIKAAGDAGDAAEDAAVEKDLVTVFGSDQSTVELANCLSQGGGTAEKLKGLLKSGSSRELARLASDTSPEATKTRKELLEKAKAKGICPK